MFGHGLDVRRFLLDVRIRGEITAIEWVDTRIFVLVKGELAWKLHTVRMERIPTLIDSEGRIAAEIIADVTFSSPVTLIANVWGVFAVGSAQAWPVDSVGEPKRARRRKVTDATVAARIAELTKRGEELKEREDRLRKQIMELMPRMAEVKAVDSDRIRRLLENATTLANRPARAGGDGREDCGFPCLMRL
jgi:hypothetical protein